MNRVTSEEVKQLLRRVGLGEVVPRLVGRSWDETYAGDVEYLVDGWKVVIFNDCDFWDYVDSVVAPDGREGDFEDWIGDADSWDQPDDILFQEDPEVCAAMMKAFIEAK